MLSRQSCRLLSAAAKGRAAGEMPKLPPLHSTGWAGPSLKTCRALRRSSGSSVGLVIRGYIYIYTYVHMYTYVDYLLTTFLSLWNTMYFTSGCACNCQSMGPEMSFARIRVSRGPSVNMCIYVYPSIYIWVVHKIWLPRY